MADLHWNEAEGELEFKLEDLQGAVTANGSRVRVRSLTHTPSQTLVGDILMTPYRALCQSGWMGELRIMSHTATPTETGVRIVWRPRPAHLAQVTMDVTPRDPNIIDVDFEVVGHANYPNYEILLSNYFTEHFSGGAYVKPLPYATERHPMGDFVRPNNEAIYRDMYVSFPRDEAAAHILSDGRWQSGRNWTRFLAARYYAHPLGVYSQAHGPLDALVMGLREDVFSVSMAYSAIGGLDRVAKHYSLYLNLFGNDLTPGSLWRTRTRMVVGPYERSADEHQKLLQQFETEAATFKRRRPVDWDSLYGLEVPK